MPTNGKYSSNGKWGQDRERRENANQYILFEWKRHLYQSDLYLPSMGLRHDFSMIEGDNWVAIGGQGFATFCTLPLAFFMFSQVRIRGRYLDVEILIRFRGVGVQKMRLSLVESVEFAYLCSDAP